MKNALTIVMLLLIGCSDAATNDSSDGYGDLTQIGNYDGGAGVLNINPNEGKETSGEENTEYACAKVYLQIPFEVRNTETNELTVELSHQLWSVPVEKSTLSENNKWYAIQTDYNTPAPRSRNANFEEEEEAYAILILEGGSTLYDQVVIPAADNSWQVCETTYCGYDGCQNHESFDHESWICHLTQSRIEREDTPNKCPCTFNETGYPYCDIRYGEAQEE